MTPEEIQGEINAMKQLLADTDYEIAQITESLMTTMQDATALNFIAKYIAWLATTVRDYGEIIRKRAAWRERLHELESMLPEEA